MQLYSIIFQTNVLISLVVEGGGGYPWSVVNPKICFAKFLKKNAMESRKIWFVGSGALRMPPRPANENEVCVPVKCV